MNWAPVHASYFPHWVRINSTLEAHDKLEQTKNDKCNLFPHQLFIRKFFGQTNSPYRGILLYHNLGTGKTITSITAAEALHDKFDIVVMLKASLENNFINEVQKCGSVPIDRYTFLHYNGLSPQTINKLGGPQFFENKVVIIDEVHNFISYVKNQKIIKKFLYDILFNAKNIKIICLSGTPIKNDVSEIALLANLLRGPMITYLLYGNISSVSKINNFLTNSPYVEDFSLDTAMNVVRVLLTPEGFKLQNKTTNMLENDQAFNHKQFFNSIKNYFSNYKFKIQIQKNTLFPNNTDDFNTLFIDQERGNIKHSNVIEHRLQGLISFFENDLSNKDLFPSVSPIHLVYVTMSDDALEKYKAIREIERVQERKAIRKYTLQKIDQDSQSNNTYKSFSRALCNFSFPESIPRVYPSTLDKIIENKKNENTYVPFEGDVLKKEKDEMMKKLKDESSKYLIGNGLLKHGPKYSAILKRLNANKGSAILYSQFREIEGLGIMDLVLQAHGYSKFEVGNNMKTHPSLRFAILTSERSHNEIILNIFNSDDNKYGEIIKLIMISELGVEGISFRNVRQVHILESAWSPISIKQVIGRASRLGSHLSLPKEDRNVVVYMYISTIGDRDSLKEDNNLTSDQIVLKIAERKDVLMQKMQHIMKRSAIDCNMYRQDCTQPINYMDQTFSYNVEDINKDIKSENLRKTNSNKIVVLKNKQNPSDKIMVLSDTSELIDPDMWNKHKLIKKL